MFSRVTLSAVASVSSLRIVINWENDPKVCMLLELLCLWVAVNNSRMFYLFVNIKEFGITETNGASFKSVYCFHLILRILFSYQCLEFTNSVDLADAAICKVQLMCRSERSHLSMYVEKLHLEATDR